MSTSSGNLELELAHLILPLRLKEAKTVAQHLDGREIIRVLAEKVDGGERVLFVKRNFKSRLKDGISTLLLRGEACSKSRAEFENYQLLRRAGIDTAEPLVYGEDMVGVWEKGSVIVTGAAAGVDLETFLLKTPKGPTRYQVLKALGPWVRAMHDAGIAFPDLFSRHIYVDTSAIAAGEVKAGAGDAGAIDASAVDTGAGHTGTEAKKRVAARFSLIDVARLDRKPNAVSMRLRARDLAALNVSVSLDLLSWHERLRFLDAYVGAAGAGGQQGRADFVRLVSERSAYLLHRRKFSTFWGESSAEGQGNKAAKGQARAGGKAARKISPRASGRHGRSWSSIPEVRPFELVRIGAAALLWMALTITWITAAATPGGVQTGMREADGTEWTVGLVGTHGYIMRSEGPLDAENAGRLAVRKFGFRTVSLSNRSASDGAAASSDTNDGIAWRLNLSAWLLHFTCAGLLALACKSAVERAVRERHGLCGHCGADRRGLGPVESCPVCRSAPGPRRLRRLGNQLGRVPMRAFEDVVLANIAPRESFDWRVPLRNALSMPRAFPAGWLRVAGGLLGLNAALIATCATVGVLRYHDAAYLFGERQLGTFASAGSLFAAGWVSLQVGRRLGGAPMAWFWKAFAVLLTILGLDDLLEFHERLDRPILRIFGQLSTDSLGMLRLHEAITLGYLFPAFWLAWRYRRKLVEATLAAQVMLLAAVAFLVHLAFDVGQIAPAVEDSIKQTAGFLILLSVVTVSRDEKLLNAWAGPVREAELR